MREGCRDWLYDKAVDLASFFDSQLDIHHIFPKAWCDTHGKDVGMRESIVNKTAISFSTNRTIGGRAPSAYLPMIDKRAEFDSSRLDAILRTHAIEPDLLRADDFEGFFTVRSKVLLSKIGVAMGKTIPFEVAETEGDFEDEVVDSDIEDGFPPTEQAA
jgi:hypothetical protein